MLGRWPRTMGCVALGALVHASTPTRRAFADDMHAVLVTDVDVGPVVRRENPELGGAFASQTELLLGRSVLAGIYGRVRYDFALRTSGGGGVALAVPLGEVVVLAPSLGAMTDGTAAFDARVFVGVRVSY